MPAVSRAMSAVASVRLPPVDLVSMIAPPLDTDGLRTALEAAGWRCTRQRSAVYECLSRADCHPTAEDVYRGVKAALPRISLATVYKALEALTAAGLATKLTAGDGSARYDARSDDHYHLRCLRSGAVQDLATPFDPELVARLDPGLLRDLRRQGFHVTGYRLELLGYFDAADAPSRPRSTEP
jgi:Fur family peroxide stress response transcriptional regulator